MPPVKILPYSSVQLATWLRVLLRKKDRTLGCPQGSLASGDLFKGQDQREQSKAHKGTVLSVVSRTEKEAAYENLSTAKSTHVVAAYVVRTRQARAHPTEPKHAKYTVSYTLVDTIYQRVSTRDSKQ